LLPTSPDEYVWAIFTDREGAHRIPLLPVVAILFALTAFVSFHWCIVRRAVPQAPALRAYSADILGSLAGIAVLVS
jgi:hypothetical protein